MGKETAGKLFRTAPRPTDGTTTCSALLAVLASRKTQEPIGRAPADESCCERYDPQISPGGFRPHKGKGYDGDTCNDPHDLFCSADVLFHVGILRVMVDVTTGYSVFIPIIAYQMMRRLSVTKSQREVPACTH